MASDKDDPKDQAEAAGEPAEAAAKKDADAEAAGAEAPERASAADRDEAPGPADRDEPAAEQRDESDRDDEDEEEDEDERDEDEDEREELGGELVAAAPAHSHGHGEHGHGDDLAHVTPVRLLVAVWASLSVLTILTVSVTHWDFGGQTNLVVAMVIATMKASLVVVFFMHLRWDRRFHALVFLSSLLFVILFIGLALTDRSEYQPNIDAYEASQALQP